MVGIHVMLTDGQVIGRDSWMFGHAGKEIDYEGTM